MRYWMLLIVVLFLSGCGGNSESSFKPPETSAKDALNAGLTAWSEGKAAGTLPAPAKGKPTIQFVDFQWTAGKKLKSFKVLEETPTLEASTHTFQVELQVEGEQPQK